jgi:hypothetical protein
MILMGREAGGKTARLYIVNALWCQLFKGSRAGIFPS